MAEVVVLEFSDPNARDIYSRVDRALGWNLQAPDADHRPAGFMGTIAGESGDKLIVVEVWASKADQEKFMATQLDPAIQEAKAPHPTSVTWYSEVVAYHLG